MGIDHNVPDLNIKIGDLHFEGSLICQKNNLMITATLIKYKVCNCLYYILEIDIDDHAYIKGKKPTLI